MTVDPERLSDEREKLAWDEYVREHGYSTCPVEPDTGADFSAGFRAALAMVAAELDAEKERAARLKACVEADDALLGAVIKAMGSRLDRDPVIAARELVAERDALRARIKAAQTVTDEYDEGDKKPGHEECAGDVPCEACWLNEECRAALAGDQPETAPEPRSGGFCMECGMFCTVPDHDAPESPHLDPEPMGKAYSDKREDHQ